MARVARSELKGNYFHILVRGLPELNIFAEHKLKMFYIKLLSQYFDNAKVLAYCVLDDHAHIVVWCMGVQAVTGMMKRVNTAFALEFNKIKMRYGYVFRERYRAQGIEDIEKVAECIGYVHSNPIFTNPRFTLKNYPYSSYRVYLEGGKVAQSFAKLCELPVDLALDYVTEAGEACKLGEWADTRSFKVHEDYGTVLKELLEKFEVAEATALKENKDKLVAFADELNIRTGAPMLFISQLTEVGRETLRRSVVMYRKNKGTRNEK